MLSFTAEIQRFRDKGEKTGWFYIDIPGDTAEQLKPGCRKSFRVKGSIDLTEVAGVALVPMGGGDFILPLNASLRRKLKRGAGSILSLRLTEDTTFKIEIPADLEICLHEEPHLIDNFMKLPKSHRNYFINWINEAKTDPTRAKRIALTVEAMDRGIGFGEIIRLDKARRNAVK